MAPALEPREFTGAVQSGQEAMFHAGTVGACLTARFGTLASCPVEISTSHYCSKSKCLDAKRGHRLLDAIDKPACSML